MIPDHYQALALKTWYAPDNPLHLDPRHPLIKLAGEAGEILDLYGKHEYKPGFSWWNCKYCGYGDASHSRKNKECVNPVITSCTPLVLDELGDWWYYFRIVSYLYGKPFSKSENYYFWGTDKLLGTMAQNSAVMLNDYLDRNIIDGSRLAVLWGCFMALLDELDCTLDRLTELNYHKLNSEPTAHGWKANDIR